ncbi:MAG: hypothetical protein ACOYT4_05070 [Nanoarchaeota archaeon]
MEKQKRISNKSFYEGKVSGLYSPFDLAKQESKKLGGRIASLEDCAVWRMAKGSEFVWINDPHFVSNYFIVNPNKEVYLSNSDFLVRNANPAVEANRNNEQHLITEKEIEQTLKDSIFLGTSGQDPLKIPSCNFSEDPRTIYIFGEHAQDYGTFLSEQGIHNLPIYLPSDKKYSDHKNAACIVPIFLHDLSQDSAILSNDNIAYFSTRIVYPNLINRILKRKI